jgi:hypothetical protein
VPASFSAADATFVATTAGRVPVKMEPRQEEVVQKKARSKSLSEFNRALKCVRETLVADDAADKIASGVRWTNGAKMPSEQELSNISAALASHGDADFTPEQYDVLQQLDGAQKTNQPRTLPRALIDLLPECSSGDGCVVCMEKKTEVGVRLPCSHLFHKSCIA